MRTIVAVMVWLMRVVLASALLTAVGILGSIGQTSDRHGDGPLSMVQKQTLSHIGHEG